MTSNGIKSFYILAIWAFNKVNLYVVKFLDTSQNCSFHVFTNVVLISPMEALLHTRCNILKDSSNCPCANFILNKLCEIKMCSLQETAENKLLQIERSYFVRLEEGIFVKKWPMTWRILILKNIDLIKGILKKKRRTWGSIQNAKTYLNTERRILLKYLKIELDNLVKIQIWK